jgi:protein TonB
MNIFKKRISRLEQKYKKVLEVSLMFSLMIVALFFYSFKSFKHNTHLPDVSIDVFDVVEIPQTEQNNPEPSPIRPPYPVEIDGDELSPDIEIEYPTIDIFAKLGDAPPLPQLKEPDVWIFELVEEKPVVIKLVQPLYPEIARKAGVEGTVVIKVLIDKKGLVEKAEIFKSIPVLDDAALQAALKCEFKPAKQRDKFVKVWMAIPFKFKLQ